MEEPTEAAPPPATVQARVLDAGDIRHERIGEKRVDTVPCGVVLKFATHEDFRRAVHEGVPVVLKF